MRIYTLLLLLCATLSGLAAGAPSDSLPITLKYRNIGPFRGGRSAAVTGVAGKPNLYYMGAAGGGVWKTTDGGQTWTNISDGFFGGSIGAVAVSESDPNVLYVGGGEVTVRGNVSSGYGMYRSEDGGRSWQEIGLKNSRHIPRLRIHPRNPDLIYAAVLGDLYKSSDERGVYRSKDGGQTWQRVLFANADAGAVDLVLDPTNPKIIWASTWRIRRTPYSLESGGEGSALWKSTDGGDTWKDMSKTKGLPGGLWGISGIAVSPVNPQRMFLQLENEKGGLFRSDDAGETWTLINDDRSLRQRAWYYSRVYADTQDEDVVYGLNVRFHKSTDGGRTFKTIDTPHSDHHDLWIAPEDNQRMVVGDDGGAQVTFDGGENWSTYLNQPTAQFYRVVTDNSFPYRIYGAQQDNSTVRIRHRADGGLIDEREWEETAGGESAHIAVDPSNNDIVYGGSYGGFLTRMDHKTGSVRAINVWPDNPMGYGAEGMKYRFQWNFPIFFSPTDAGKLYAASNHLHLSTDEGQSWQIISPDLTRNDASKLVSSGGPITKDNTGVEYYATIFAAGESATEPGFIVAASDDGLVHVTRNGGTDWTNVTPKDAPEWMMWNSVEFSTQTPGKVYLAGTRYKLGDYQPYLYVTDNYGKTWRKIVSGIPAEHFTRVLRADPARPGLLFAGTEKGIYVSRDDGKNWQPFQYNLPIVPVTDLAIKDDDLIVATQGRSFWIIDDLGPLRQLDRLDAKADAYLFKPRPAYRLDGSTRSSRTAGTNHPGGMVVDYYVNPKLPDSTLVQLAFLDRAGDTIRHFSSKAEKKEDKLEWKAGHNQFNWNLRYPEGTDFDGMILWWAGVGGPSAAPGDYRVVLTVAGKEQSAPAQLLADPRATAKTEDLQAQFTFMRQVQEKVSEAHQVIIDLRAYRTQIKDLTARLGKDAPADLKAAADSISAHLTAVEEALYQTKNQSGQDPLNYPIRLTNKLAHLNSLVGIGDYPPTAQAYAVKDEMTGLIDAELVKFRRVVEQEIPAFNRMVREREVDVIRLKEPGK
ncbi:MAG: glycosyl hydrolase [Saprospiraceae bacterium]